MSYVDKRKVSIYLSSVSLQKLSDIQLKLDIYDRYLSLSSLAKKGWSLRISQKSRLSSARVVLSKGSSSRISFKIDSNLLKNITSLNLARFGAQGFDEDSYKFLTINDSMEIARDIIKSSDRFLDDYCITISQEPTMQINAIMADTFKNKTIFVPATIHRAVDPDTYEPKIVFKAAESFDINKFSDIELLEELNKRSLDKLSKPLYKYNSSGKKIKRKVKTGAEIINIEDFIKRIEGNKLWNMN